MSTINFREAKTHFSGLVDQAAAGDEIVIAKAGKPLARLMPLAQGSKRKLGMMAGKISVPADFDAPLPDDVRAAVDGRSW